MKLVVSLFGAACASFWIAVSLAPFIVLGWLAVGVVVVFAVYRGRRAGDLRLAGVAMGEAVEEAIEERTLTAPGELPPPGEDR